MTGEKSPLCAPHSDKLVNNDAHADFLLIKLVHFSVLSEVPLLPPNSCSPRCAQTHHMSLPGQEAKQCLGPCFISDELGSHTTMSGWFRDPKAAAEPPEHCLHAGRPRLCLLFGGWKWKLLLSRQNSRLKNKAANISPSCNAGDW